MTTVIVGANGQLGRALQREFPDAVALDRSQLDVTDAAAVRDYRWADVDVVLNAAAWTAVDAAEDPANLDAVRAANVDAVGHLARAVRTSGATLVHISSEYVFDGRHEGPIPEDLPASPLSVYGQSKADGDAQAAGVTKHYLVRTTWVVGDGGNFVRTMAGLADRGVSPTVVDDQIGRPTFTADLAAGIAHLLRSRAPFGTYNLTNAGEPALLGGRRGRGVRRPRPVGGRRRAHQHEGLLRRQAAGRRPPAQQRARPGQDPCHRLRAPRLAHGTDGVPRQPSLTGRVGRTRTTGVTGWSRLPADLPMISSCGGCGLRADWACGWSLRPLWRW